MCSIVPHALHLDEQHLINRCFNLIDTQTKAVLDSQSFFSISQEVLVKIVKRDTLVGAREIDIFNSCLKWAGRECERNGWEGTTANKRQALGNVLNLIRFPLMPLDTFSNQVTTAGILNKDESLSVFLYLTRKNSNLSFNESPPFPLKKRVSNTPQQNKSDPHYTVCPSCSSAIRKQKGHSPFWGLLGHCPSCGKLIN